MTLTSDRGFRGGECGGDHETETETETETDDATTKTHQMKKIVPHPFQINAEYRVIYRQIYY
jgi:hypothetical protein